jgi:hypothetical protein
MSGHRAINQDVESVSVPRAATKSGLMALSKSRTIDHQEPRKGTLPRSQTSPRKINANRHNAQKSSGPRTPRGKAAIRFNALKHGFLSKQVVISSKHIQESTADFRGLVAECWDYFQPVGRPEELIVEQIAVCFWNSRRAIRCELGEVERSIRLDQEQFEAKQDDFTSLMLAIKIWTLETAKSEIQTQGVLSDRTVSNIYKDFGKYDISTPEYLVCQGPDREGWKKILLQKIEDYLRWWHLMLENIEQLEGKEAEARKESLALPRAEALGRIMRYQAANERRLHKCFAELERLQRQRKGEYVPPPVKVAVDGPERD